MEPLERQPKESKRANQALRDYAHMGMGRSLRALHNLYLRQASERLAYKPPSTKLQTVFGWSMKFNWQNRIRDWEQDNQREDMTAYEQERKEDRAARIGLLKATRGKLVQRLDKIEPQDMEWQQVLTGVRMVISELRKEYDDEPILRVAKKIANMDDDELLKFIQDKRPLDDEDEDGE